METSSKYKTCKVCFKEIDSRAQKCPHCHHWQSRIAKLIYAPVPSLFVLGFLLCFIFFTWETGEHERFLKSRESFNEYRSDVSIKESSLKFGGTDARPTVAIIGTIENATNISWKYVKFEVQFFDGGGKLIDISQKRIYTTLKAKGDTNFKLSVPREFPEEQYASHTVNILSATDARGKYD